MNRNHVAPEQKLCMPTGDFPIPVIYIDGDRQTNTSLDVLHDYWIVDEDRLLSDPWIGVARFTILMDTRGFGNRLTEKNKWEGIQKKDFNTSSSNHDHKEDAIEAHRPRIEEGRGRKHQDPIADRGHISMTHYNLVYKPPPLPQAMNFPDAQAAVDK